MRTVLCLTLFLLAGCSGSPPKPPMPEGDYRPINNTQRDFRAREKARPQTTHHRQENFDFFYEGDISGALSALKAVVPEIVVVPPMGKPVPIPVRVRLYKTTLEKAIHSISLQGGEHADVAINIRFAGREVFFNTFLRFYPGQGNQNG